jgi:hypothetical protein
MRYNITSWDRRTRSLFQRKRRLLGKPFTPFVRESKYSVCKNGPSHPQVVKRKMLYVSSPYVVTLENCNITL